MKKLIMLLVMGIVAMGFTGCKKETLEDKAKKDAEELKNTAEDKAEAIMKNTQDKLPKPKDHPAH